MVLGNPAGDAFGSIQNATKFLIYRDLCITAVKQSVINCTTTLNKWGLSDPFSGTTLSHCRPHLLSWLPSGSGILPWAWL